MNYAFFKRLKRRWRYILLGYLGNLVLACLGTTLRFTFAGEEQFEKTASQGKCILMFWHNRLIISAEILKRIAPKISYAALISDSRDGELIASLARSYKRGRAIRVPHNARSAALKYLIKELQNNGDVKIITPDGPRGPAFQVKPGIVLAALKTSAVIVPMTWRSTSYWRFRTWDGLLLPKPFSKILVTFGNPVTLNEGTNTSLIHGKEILEKALRSIESVN